MKRKQLSTLEKVWMSSAAVAALVVRFASDLHDPIAMIGTLF